MKASFFSKALHLILAVTLLFSSGVTIQPDRVYAASNMQISIADCEFEPGETKDIDVILTGNTGIAGCSLTVSLPEGFVLNSIKAGEILTGGTFSVYQTSFAWYALDNIYTNGKLVTLNITAGEDAEDGTIGIAQKDGKPNNVSDEEGITVSVEMIGAKVTVNRPIQSECDKNGHDYVAKVTKPADCTDDGVMTYTCSRCDDSYTEVIRATGHDYANVVTAPTCTEKGYTTHTCKNCGNSYKDTETEALGHDYVGKETKPATPDEDGEMTYTCSRCDESYTEAIPAKGHDYEETVVPPTCTENGYTLHTCNDCGKSYKDTETEALGHDYSGKVTKPASCTEDGVKTITCSRCDDSYTEAIKATGHDYAEVVTAPTCTEKGYTTHTCKNCDDSYTDTETEALGHDYSGKVTKPANCTEDGVKTYICSRCDESYTEAIKATGHEYVAVVTDPTCTEKGYTTHTCKNCYDSYTDTETEALGHDYSSKVTKPAGCTEEGEMLYICSRCSDFYLVPVKPTGHDYAEVVTAPTCTEKGYTTYTCRNCDDGYTDTETEALGHDYSGKVTKPATPDEDGEMTYTCSRCDETYIEVIPATGHDYEVTVVPPTCTENGYTLHTCKDCGKSYKDTETEALGHDYSGKVTKPAECTEDGIKTYTCSRCDESYEEEIPATGHDYMDEVTAPTCTEGGYTTHTCKNCDEVYIDADTDPLGHDFVEKETKPADCTEDGEMTYTCSRCDESYTEVIPATGHDYAEVVTEPTCTEKGYTTHTCKNCDDNYIDSETDALGHRFSNYIYNKDAKVGVDGTETAVCDNGCGEKDTRTKVGSALTENPVVNPFVDVDENSDYDVEQAVLWAVEKKITKGTSETTFSPDEDCTRAQVVTFLWRAAGMPEPATVNNPFSDIKSGDYFYKAVLWAVENGITQGTSATTFSPNKTCTRAQVVTFQWRAAGKPDPASADNPFEDVTSGQYYYKAVLWAVENDITQGMSETSFGPEATCTRGQIVTFLYRAAQ